MPALPILHLLIAAPLCVAPVYDEPVAERPMHDHVQATAQQQAAIDRGLTWLADHQGADGIWQSEPPSIGLTAVAGLAFMADGHLPGEGLHGTRVRRALIAVLDTQRADGLIAVHGKEMYEQGLCALFLAAVCGTTGEPALELRSAKALRSALRLIEAAQQPDGGWGYKMTQGAAGSHTDLSLSVTQLMALRVARDAGFSVDAEVVARGVSYVESRFDPRAGGFCYQGDRGAQETMTAAGIVSLQVCGRLAASDEKLSRGLTFLRERKARFKPGMKWYFYGAYYGVQAAYQAGGEAWKELFQAFATELLESQGKDGSWTGSGSDAVMATGMAVIALAAPKRLLPIYVQEERAR